MKSRLCFLPCLAALAFAGCVSVDVKPVHIIVDVNVKIDRALDDFFGDLDKKSTTLADPSAKTH